MDNTDPMFKPNEIARIIEQPPVKIVPEIVQDFNDARDNIKDTIEITQQAVATCAQVADQSQGWQYYNALASLIRAANEANRDLMDIYKKKKDLQQDAPPKQVTNQVILTSADMLRIIKEGEANDSNSR